MLHYIRSLRLKGVYLDVGANIGNHSIYFAVNTDAERVISIEAQPNVFGALSDMISANSLGAKVQPVNAIAGPHDGVYQFRHHARRKHLVEETGRSIAIDGLTTDKVSLVKMDIEGGEAAALQGMTRILSEDKPVLFIEIQDDTSMEKVMEVLEPFGYRPTGRKWNPSPTYELVAE